jgi:hypothetical protein
MSSGTPATTNAAPGSARVSPRKPGGVANVGVPAMWTSQVKNLLFLKKKKQKDFYPLAPVLAGNNGERMKVFWFFFS